MCVGGRRSEIWGEGVEGVVFCHGNKMLKHEGNTEKNKAGE